MDYKGTKVSTSTEGEIALNFFVFVIPSCCMTSGDFFELRKKFVLYNAHDDKLQDNLTYDIDISTLVSVNDLTRHETVMMRMRVPRKVGVQVQERGGFRKVKNT